VQSVKLVLPHRETGGGQEQGVEEQETTRSCKRINNLHNFYSAPNRSKKVKVKQSRYRPGVAQRVPGS